VHLKDALAGTAWAALPVNGKIKLHSKNKRIATRFIVVPFWKPALQEMQAGKHCKYAQRLSYLLDYT
jgi:hypothetical protein